MAYSISTSNVTISHFGATDVTDGVGSTKYNIFFDASLVNYGPALMFEYRIRQTDSSGNEEYILGYVNTENGCIQSGIENQYVVSVLSQNFDYESDTYISMRVYIGYTDRGSCETTPWSNELQIHNAPETREIFSTYFDLSGALNDLYVFLDDNNIVEPYPNDPSLNYLVAYYYEDPSGDTVWKVSDLLQSTVVTLATSERQMLTIANFGNVSLTKPIINVAVYTVWQFQDLDEKNYYAVSHISETVLSHPAEDYSAPTLHDISYNVYNNGVQSMTLTWEAADTAGIPTFTVDYYTVEYRTRPSGESVFGDWQVVTSDISGNIYYYEYMLNEDEQVCGTLFEFRVIAVSTTGTPSRPSNIESESYFEYATEPLNLTITNIDVNPSWVGMTVNFVAPANLGCAGSDARQFLITNDSNENFSVVVPYNPSATSYSVDISFNIDASSGYIYVVLQNPDTNSDSLIDGATASTSYIVAEVVLEPVVYHIYTDDRTQLMDLTWSNTEVNGWNVTYTLNIIDGSGNPQIDISGKSYTFDSSSYPPDASFSFTVTGHYSDASNSYDVISNTETKYYFEYATEPLNLTITDIVVNNIDQSIDMSVNFVAPANIGSVSAQFGTRQFLITNNSNENFSVVVPYDPDATSYSVPVNFNLNGYNSGYINVVLRNLDTNSDDLIDGDMASTSYVAGGVVLNNVFYRVYTTDEQLMDLSWNNTVVDGWDVTYTLDVIDGSGNQQINDISDNFYNFDTSSYPLDAFFSFTVTGHYADASNNYSFISNPVYQYYFERATEPLNLTITDISNNSDWVGMTVNFEEPANIGSAGNGTRQFLITNNTNDFSAVVPYDAGAESYSVDISFNLNGYNSGYINVVLRNPDTNSANLINGVATSTSYVVAEVVLDPVSYRVYTDMSSQVMELTWDNTVVGGWDVTYTLDVIDGSGNQQINNISDNFYNFDTSSYPLDASFSFTVTGHYADASNNYSFISNTVYQYKYVYSEKPRNVLLGWSVADVSNQLMDVQLEFMNPVSTGSGVPTEFTVTIHDESDAEIDSKQVRYIDSSSNKYIVSFINIPYSYVGDIELYLSTQDTNSDSNLAGYEATLDYQTSAVPIIKDISYGATGPLTFKVISSILVTGVQINVTYKNSSGDLVVGGQVDFPVLDILDASGVLIITQDDSEGDAFIYEYTIPRNTLIDTSSFVAGYFILSASNGSGIGTEYKDVVLVTI